jgi:hypothetical protein
MAKGSVEADRLSGAVQQNFITGGRRNSGQVFPPLRALGGTPICDAMARPSRTNDWGFPRWRGYGSERGATRVRLCDREGCTEPGDCPAPKAPNSPERWYFCQTHAGEYNRGWDYFAGLSAEEAARRKAEEQQGASAYTQSRHQQWAGPGDGSRSGDEIRALGVLEVEVDATFEEVRAAWRRLAKANHPDVRPDDAAAADRFRAIQAAWDVLRTAEERRSWKPA